MSGAIKRVIVALLSRLPIRFAAPLARLVRAGWPGFGGA